MYLNFSLDSRYLTKIKNYIGAVLLAGESRSVWRKTCSSVPPCLSQILYGLTQNRTRVSAMRGQQVAASTLAWTFREFRLPKLYLKKSCLNQCYLKINFVPLIERILSWVLTKQLMLLEKISVVCGQNVDFLNVKSVGTESNYGAVRKLRLCSKFTVILGESSFLNCIELRFVSY